MSHSTRRRHQLEIRKSAELVETRPVNNIGVPPPPDNIFKNRKNRQAPAQDVWGVQGTISYIPIKAEYIEGKGNFVWYKDVPFPSKTVAPVEAIHAMAGAKRLTISAFRFLSKIHKKGRMTRLFQAFNDTADMMVNPYYLEEGYYCPVAKETKKFVKTLLISFGVAEPVADKTGEIMGMFFEYDNAYRLRIQDLAEVASQYDLVFNMPKELERLIGILGDRETARDADGIKGSGSDVTFRFQSAATVLKWIWRVPPFKNKLKKALAGINLDLIKPDDADIYHTLLFKDYNVRGKTIEERMKILEAIHGQDMNKWPPRILIKPPQAPQMPQIGEKIVDFTMRITGKTEEEVIKLIKEGNLRDTEGRVFSNPNLVFTDKGFA